MIDRASAPDVTVAPLDRVPDGVQDYSERKNSYGDSYVLWLAGRADVFPAWGTNLVERDALLREFWPTEPYLASSFGSQISRYAGFPYVLDGPERTTAIYNRILNGCEDGQGFQTMMTKVVTDMFTQSNAGWMELIRTADAPTAPVVSMRHMDSGQCRRTGYPDTPVVFYDLRGKAHLMKWYQVIEFPEMPSPNIHHRGLQLSVLDRILRASQIMKAIQQFKLERVTGLHHHTLHLVGGFNQNILDETLKQKLAAAQGQNRQAYADPVLLAALRSDGAVTHEEIKLSELPPDFNEEVFMKWYIGNIALAWEDEYQSFFPLPGGNLGTAQQSQTMADKARARGPATFMRLVEQRFNFWGVLPNNIKFVYGEQDPTANQQQIQLAWRFAQMLKLLLESNTVDQKVAQLMMRDAGFLKPEYLKMLNPEEVPPAAVESDNPIPGQ